MNLIEVLQLVVAPVAVYVAIRVDMAAMKVRLDHLERDIYGNHPTYRSSQNGNT